MCNILKYKNEIEFRLQASPLFMCVNNFKLSVVVNYA